jgi:inorganic phosphate transporter, PiT family
MKAAAIRLMPGKTRAGPDSFRHDGGLALGLAVAICLAFSLTNGFHDAANAIATLVATRGARPGQAIVLSAIFNVLGALLLGTAVAGTIAGIVTVPPSKAVAVVGSGVLGAVIWNLLTWYRGLPSSSGHALVGGLVGAALAEEGGGAVNVGGVRGLHPTGVVGVLVALAVSPVVGLLFGFLFARFTTRALARGTRRLGGPIRASEWGMTAALSFSHGANDAQKAMGAIGALLLATGHLASFGVPLWAKLASGAALTIGTALGGWRIVRTIGRRIFPLVPIDGFASQSASTAVILTASFAGAPVSTTHVVASSVAGVGGGRRRWHHVRWAVVRSMGIAWILTLPATAALGAITVRIWSALS